MAKDVMGTAYERTFVVAAPATSAWLALTDPEQREAWMGNPQRDRFEAGEITIDAVEPLRSLSFSQRYGGLGGGYQTTISFAEVPAGTRMTIVRSGFGDSEAWRHYVQHTARGWDELIADLILYLETGVRGGRHFSFSSGLGATMLESGAGVRITHVVPDGFAAAAGMRAGDLLLRLNGASVVHLTDVAFLGREHAPGEIVEVEYVRCGSVLRSRAPLSHWHHGDDTYVAHPGAYPTTNLLRDRDAAGVSAAR
jgi:uncharacterized protein YndB with AHSA1/START domain